MFGICYDVRNINKFLIVVFDCLKLIVNYSISIIMGKFFKLLYMSVFYKVNKKLFFCFKGWNKGVK